MDEETHVEDYSQPTRDLEAELRAATEADQANAQAELDRKAAAAAQRQRDEDAALADIINAAERMRDRNGRSFFTMSDARAIREAWGLLKGMAGADGP